MAYISLTKGLRALVDDELFERLNKHKWYASGRKGREYAARRAKTGFRKLIYMHHEVLDFPMVSPGEHTDHRNGDRLDNRRDNLVVGTAAQNAQNSDRVRNQAGV